MKRVTILVILAGLLAGMLVLVLRPGTLPKVHAQNSCTTTSFSGAYGYTFQGSFATDNGFLAPASTGLFAAAGRLVADGRGNLSGAETSSSDGEISQRTYTGRYKVNSDCTGSASTIDNSGITTRCDFVIVGGGREVLVVEADPGTVIVGSLKQQ